MRTRYVILAALLAGAGPASASLIGDAVVIKRVQGGSVFKTVDTIVGDGLEYSDNLFSVDVTENEIVFTPAGGNFSIGDVVYTLEGLDFDDKPATPNIVLDFATAQIFGSVANPFDSKRVTIDAAGKLTLSLKQTTGGASGFARVTLGAPAPAVPEPASWAMMLGGFSLLGAATRRRARPAAFA